MCKAMRAERCEARSRMRPRPTVTRELPFMWAFKPPSLEQQGVHREATWSYFTLHCHMYLVRFSLSTSFCVFSVAPKNLVAVPRFRRGIRRGKPEGGKRSFADCERR